MRRMHANRLLAGTLGATVLLIGNALFAPDAAAQKVGPGVGGPPPVVTTTPPPTVTPPPQPDFTRLLNYPTVGTTGYPYDPPPRRRPDPKDEDDSDNTGDRPPTGKRDLTNLQGVSAIGQLMFPANPKVDPVDPPVTPVLHKLENRLPKATARTSDATADSRAGALKALENAKPIL